MSDVAYMLGQSDFDIMFSFTYVLYVALFAGKKIYAVGLVESDGLCYPIELFICPIFDVV